jgi:hypothetical protein
MRQIPERVCGRAGILDQHSPSGLRTPHVFQNLVSVGPGRQLEAWTFGGSAAPGAHWPGYVSCVRVSGALVALSAALLLVQVADVSAADPLGTPSRLVRVGPGVSESSQRQVVRTRERFVYIASVDDDGYSGGAAADLHMYRATSAGVPTAFASADAAHDPHVTQPLDLSGGDARIDAAGIIHLTYVIANLGNDDAGGYAANSLRVMYQTFDTATDTWGSAEAVSELPAEGDGLRGKVVSALALDPSGKPLVVTASSSGVSAWSPAASGGWSRTAISDPRALHPSLAIDTSGRAHLAWLSSPSDKPSIRYASRAPSGDWSAPEIVADADVLSNDTNDQSPSLAFDASARPIALWLDANDDIRIGIRDADGVWRPDDPSPTFTHTPGLYLRGNDRVVFLGHDADGHPAYLSHAAGAPDWSTVGVFAPPADEDGYYAYDGSASVRFDPLFDPDCRIVDVAFFAEYSERPGRVGKPDLYYAAVTLPEPPGGCAQAAPASADGAPSAPPPDPPPPPPAPDTPGVLLGDQHIGPQLDGNDSGMAEAFQTVATAAGTVRSISVYIDPVSTAERVAVGVYDDVDGHPSALLAQGSAIPRPGEWNTIELAATSVTAGERYWLAILGTGGGRLGFRDATDQGCRGETTPASQALDSLPSTWTTGVEWGDCPLAAYGSGQ